MIDLFAPKSATNAEAAARVKGWVRDVMGFPEDTTITVIELRCREDDCPDVETVIAVLGEPGKARKHKVVKPLADVTFDDILSLAARGTHG